MIRIFVADDHSLIREGIRRILADVPDMEVTGEATSGAELREKIRGVVADVLLLDISFPDAAGLELLCELPEALREKTLMLSIHPAESFAKRALRAGAAGYLTKECVPEELEAAVRRVFRGGRVISPEVAEELAEDLSIEGCGPPHELLSEREYQLLIMLGSGKSVSEIAHTLSLSVHTVNSYRQHILEKMGLHSTIELVQYTMRHGLVE